MTWIPEKQAAEMVGRKPQSLRKNVKKGIWRIDYTAPNGRRYMYSLNGIEKMLMSFSSATKK